MKSYLILLSLLTVGCARYPQSSLPRPLANLPTEPHQREVAILFANDPPPSESYIKIGVLEAYGDQFTSYNDLIRNLQQQGQDLGVDAVQLLGKDYVEETEGVDAITTYVTTTLSGLGMLYLKNADYLSRYVQSKEVYFYNDTTGRYDELILRKDVSYDGTEPTITGNRIGIRFLRDYSLDHLYHEETADWWYASDAKGRVFRRGYHPEGYLLKTVKFSYDSVDRVKEAQIRYTGGRRPPETIQFIYNEQGKVKKKHIYQDGKLTLREIPAYDKRGQCAGSEFFRIGDGQRGEPYLRVVYRFFDPENLPVHESLVNVLR